MVERRWRRIPARRLIAFFLVTETLSVGLRGVASIRTAEGAIPTPWAPRGPLTRREVLTWLRQPSTRWTPF